MLTVAIKFTMAMMVFVNRYMATYMTMKLLRYFGLRPLCVLIAANMKQFKSLDQQAPGLIKMVNL